MGNTFLPRRFADVLDRLGHAPARLFVLLLAVNALALPYADLVHDAVLYRLQILNRALGGAFAEDLYFKYGSQDRYSVFALLAAPVVQLAGHSVGAFLLYLAGNAAFLWAIQRFVGLLLPDRRLTVLVLLFLAITPIPFGGNNIFPLNENYLTPRLFANTLVLFGLTRMLDGRWLPALGLLLAGLACHPLMAVSGLLIWGGWLLATQLRRTSFLLVLVVVGSLAVLVLAHEPLGVRLFGYMDAEWQGVERRLVGYNFPETWTGEDWLRIAAAFGIVLGAWYGAGLEPAIQRFLLVLVGVAAAGLLGTLLAGVLPYALLLQAQPYRALWLLQLVQLPLALLLLVQRWWDTGDQRLRAAGWVLLGYLGVSSLSGTVQMYLVLLPLIWLAFALHGSGVGARPRAAGRLWMRAGLAVLVTLACGAVLKAGLLVSTFSGKTNPWHPLELNRYIHLVFDPFFQLGFGAVALLLAGRLLDSVWYYRVTLAIALGVQVSFFALLQTPFWVEKLRPAAVDVPFVQEVLRPHQESAGQTLTVYWPCGRAELLWLDLRVNSFFHRDQLVGCLFSRSQLVEAKRRVALVERFEEPWLARALFDLPYSTSTPAEPPSKEDLLRLCQEPGLDFVVLEQDFGDLAAVTNGRWYIYNCQQVRALR